MTTVDLDAARAARLEAIGEGVTATLLGVTFDIPHPKRWPVKVTTLLAEGRLDAAFALMVGRDVADKLGDELTMSDLEAVFAAVATDQGLTPGE